MPVQLALSDGALLMVTVLAAFLSTAALVLAVTTPAQTPPRRLKQYARYTGRRGSPGVEAGELSFRERLVGPVLRRVIEFAARGAPSRARRTVTAELSM